MQVELRARCNEEQKERLSERKACEQSFAVQGLWLTKSRHQTLSSCSCSWQSRCKQQQTRELPFCIYICILYLPLCAICHLLNLNFLSRCAVPELATKPIAESASTESLHNGCHCHRLFENSAIEMLNTN